jgi:hypothetical protein
MKKEKVKAKPWIITQDDSDRVMRLYKDFMKNNSNDPKISLKLTKEKVKELMKKTESQVNKHVPLIINGKAVINKKPMIGDTTDNSVKNKFYFGI